MKYRFLILFSLSYLVFSCQEKEAKSKISEKESSDTSLVEYQNPVIPGFYPDPSICRVGEDYYLVNSSFHYFPGVPIFHSKDLVNWRQIGNVLDRKSQLNLENVYTSGGIFAPTIRYHNGVFYMVTTLVGAKKGGNFFVTADKAEGPWSEPIWIDADGIDPSLYFDEDGKVFLTTSISGGIGQSEIDIKTGKLLTKHELVWKGTGGRFPEGPHLFKKDGFYYLLISEGGTEYGHYVVISRSKNPNGPFESCPNNPILTHRDQGMNVLQGTGHADFVEDQHGNWWTVFLGFRQSSWFFHHLGRETCLAPLTWDKNGWPIVNDSGSVEITMRAKLPAPLSKDSLNYASTDFNEKLGAEWMYVRNPDSTKYLVADGSLKIKSASALNEVGNPSFVGIRQKHMNLTVSTTVSSKEEAGLTFYMDEKHHYDFYVEQVNGKTYVVLKGKIGPLYSELGRKEIQTDKAELQVNSNKKMYEFFLKENGNLISIGKADSKYLSTEVASGFMGTLIGLYAVGEGNEATFSDFQYKPLGENKSSVMGWD